MKGVAMLASERPLPLVSRRSVPAQACGRRRLWTHNPFYLISAVLVLLGLLRLSQAAAGAGDRWVLFGIVQGYTILVAAAAVLIVRVARVWEDARSVLLVLVLLLGIGSVGAEPILEWDTSMGSRALAVSLALSILLSEGVLIGTGLGMSAFWRIPYYGFLGVFHATPVLLAHLREASYGGVAEDLSLGLYLFPWVGGMLVLSLVPAVRRGRRVADGDGSPWTWPAFPCVVFLVLFGCLAVRAVLFGFTYHPGPAGTFPIGGSALAPLVLAGGVVLFEFGRRERRRAFEAIGRWVPLVACLSALPHSLSSSVELRFLESVAGRLANPALMVGGAALAFYAWRSLAGDRGASIGIWLSVAALAFLAPRSFSTRAPGWEVMAALAGVASYAALRSRRSFEALVTVGALAGLAARLASAADLARGTAAILGANVFLVGVVAIGALYRGPIVGRIAVIAGCLFLTGWCWAGYRRFSTDLNRPGVDLVLWGLFALVIAGLLTVAKSVRIRGGRATTDAPNFLSEAEK